MLPCCELRKCCLSLKYIREKAFDYTSYIMGEWSSDVNFPIFAAGDYDDRYVPVLSFIFLNLVINFTYCIQTVPLIKP